ncbi:hypothetical protein MKW92_019671 [Papaver armeniacum]|nr:hypothetical protein MKW92_019671 [Papaver armeniacum]
MLLQLGSAPTLVISSAEAAEQVLKTLDHEFCTRPPLAGPKRLSYNYKDVAFGPYGEYWREARKICVHELLSATRVQSFKVVRAEEIDVLIDFISSSSNSPIDVFDTLASVTHKIIYRVAFGSTTGQSRDRFNGRLTKVLDEVVSVLSGFSATDFFPKVGWIIDRITGLHRRTEEIFHDLDVLFEQMIEEHLSPVRPQMEEHEDLIDVLLKLKDDQTSTISLANDNIKGILTVTNLFFFSPLIILSSSV